MIRVLLSLVALAASAPGCCASPPAPRLIAAAADIPVDAASPSWDTPMDARPDARAVDADVDAGLPFDAALEDALVDARDAPIEDTADAPDR